MRSLPPHYPPIDPLPVLKDYFVNDSAAGSKDDASAGLCTWDEPSDEDSEEGCSIMDDCEYDGTKSELSAARKHFVGEVSLLHFDAPFAESNGAYPASGLVG